MVDPTCRRGHTIPDELMGGRCGPRCSSWGLCWPGTGRRWPAGPGDAPWGARPIDLHIRAFQALGAQVRSWNGRLSFYGPRLHGRRLALPIPSVGATENAMLAACGAQGITVIDNPAREPEIVDLQGFLPLYGGPGLRRGDREITIQGGCRLHAGEYTVMADRIVAATYLCAVAAAGGEGELLGTQGEDLGPVLAALEAAGCETGRAPNRLWIRRRGPPWGRGQPVYRALSRLSHRCPAPLAAALAGERGRAGSPRPFLIAASATPRACAPWARPFRWRGTPPTSWAGPLHGAQVAATDLRGRRPHRGGSGRPGPSRIWGLDHVDRGYEGLETALAALGKHSPGDRPVKRNRKRRPLRTPGRGTERPPWDRGGVSAC